MNLEIPDEFNTQGAKLSTLMQATAYKGILERKQVTPRPTTEKNLRLTCTAIQSVTTKSETDAAIWNNTRKSPIRPLIQQFLYKTMHKTHMVGKYWRHINGYEERESCAMCNETESMSHILTQCKERTTQLIWRLAKSLWPHRHIPWPEITLGTILGCGSINLHPTRPEGRNQRRTQPVAHQGPTRLFQILMTESTYLVWTLRCERVIQEKTLSDGEIRARWHCAINERLTNDKVTATKIRRSDKFTKMIKETWEPMLRKEGELPETWPYCREVLVGRTVW